MNHPIFFSVAVLNLIKGVYYKYIQLVEVVSNTVFHPIFFRLGRKKIQFELMNLFHHGIEATNKGKFMGSFFADHLGSRPTDCTTSVTSKLYGDFIFSCLEVHYMFFLAYLLCCFCIEKTWTVLIESSADRGNARTILVLTCVVRTWTKLFKSL